MSEPLRIARKKDTLPVPAQQTEHEIQPLVQEVLSSSGQPLDTATRDFMEPRFGYDFSQVRIHTDERAAESAQAVNALAYTVGQDVVFGAGQYVPQTSGGQHLLAHELAHVVQQDKATTIAPMTEQGSSTEIAAQTAAMSVVERGQASDLLPAGLGIAREEAPPQASGQPVSVNEDSVELSASIEEADDEATLGDEDDKDSLGHAILEGASGIGYGTVQALTPGGFLAPSPEPQSQRFEFFRAAGQIATGLTELAVGGIGEVVGGGLDVTGVGTAAGVALNIGSAMVIANAATNVVAGVQGLTHAMTMQGDGSGGGGPRLPKKGTPERAAIEAARKRGIRGAQAKELENIRAGGKGSGVWTDEELEQIRSTGEFPKDALWHHEPTVANRPDLADDPSVVRPVRGGIAGHLAAHGGDFRK